MLPKLRNTEQTLLKKRSQRNQRRKLKIRKEKDHLAHPLMVHLDQMIQVMTLTAPLVILKNQRKRLRLRNQPKKLTVADLTVLQVIVILHLVAPALDLTLVVIVILTQTILMAQMSKRVKSSRKVSSLKSINSWPYRMNKRPQLKEDGSGFCSITYQMK